MSKQLLIFAGVGLAVIAVAIFFVFSSTKGSHLVLTGKIIKVRTGALSDADSIAVVDFRVTNPSDVPFMVREVEVKLDKKDGSEAVGVNVSKSDLKPLFQYNRFLGEQYNDSLSIRDTVPPHQTVDRMVAVRFDMKDADLEDAKMLHLGVQDMDGAMFEATHSVK